MTYQLNKNDLEKIKSIGFEKMIHDFGYVIGSNMGGCDGSYEKAQMFMRDFLEELSNEFETKTGSHLDRQDYE